MKDIIVGDIHFGKRNNDIRHNQDLVDFFDNLIEASRYEDYRLIVQGDVFEQRDKLDVRTINYAIETFKRLSKAFKEIILIKGNHDLYFRDTRDVSSLAILEPYVTRLVDYYYIEEDRMYVSWLVSAEEYDEIVNISLEKNINYMFAHFEFNSFRMNDHYVMEHGQSHKALKHVKKVFTSHYHKRQILDNVEYIGAPFGFEMNDANDTDKGFVIFDTDTGESEHIPYMAVKVVSLSYDEFMMQAYQDPENTTIRVVIDKELTDSQYDELTEKLKSTGFRDVKTVNTINKIKQAIESTPDSDLSNLGDVDSMVLQYLSGMVNVDGIDSQLLKDLYATAKESANG